MSQEPEEREEFQTPDLLSPTQGQNPQPQTGPTTRARAVAASLEEAAEEAKEDSLGELDSSYSLSTSRDTSSDSVSVDTLNSGGIMANTNVTIGGVSISTTPTPSTTVTGSLITLKKADRSKLDADKRQELFARITRKDQQEKFQLLSQSIASVDDLQETYDLQLNLITLETAFTRYDIGDVFTIVFPTLDADGSQTGALDQENGTTKTRNLFNQFNTLSTDEVVQSSTWYARWPDASTAPWFQENLSLSFDYLQSHMETDLWGKVMEDLQPYYGSQAQGGPLIFLFMMKRLQVNSQLVIEALQTKLESLRIDQYPGEDVSVLVGHARAIFRRLRSLEKRDSDGTVLNPALPHGINQTLLRLFQTSSDKKFNEIFHTKEIQAYEASLSLGDKAYGKPELILDLAVQVYTSILSSKEGWTGQFHKVSDSGFNSSSTAGNTCHNCGGDHLLKDCPEPKNEARISKNKQAFWDARNKDRGGRGGRGGRSGRGRNGRGGRGRGGRTNRSSKWPSPPSDRRKNRTKINGTWHYYHFATKKWQPCDDQTDAANLPSAAPATTSPTPETNSPVPPVQTPSPTIPQATPVDPNSEVSSSSQASAKAAIPDLVSSINAAMTDFVQKL